MLNPFTCGNLIPPSSNLRTNGNILSGVWFYTYPKAVFVCIERGPLEDEDVKSKSEPTQAIKLFSEGNSPVEVAIALDLPTDQVLEYTENFGNLKECMD